MKLYSVTPILPANSDSLAIDARLEATTHQITELIVSRLSCDPALFAMRHMGEIADPPVQPDVTYGYVQVARLSNTDNLRTVIRESLDVSSGKWMLVRSLVTCRFIRCDDHGGALVCLATEDPPLVSPNESMIHVEECSRLLTETDWLDGVIPHD